MKFKNQALSLHSDTLPADTLLVQKLHGEERMSGMFRFELDLICEDAELDLEAILYAPAKLGIKVSIPLSGGQVGSTSREITGVFESFEQHEQGQGWVKYHAVLVPKIWQTTRAQRSRVFQEKSIEDLVTDVLKTNDLDPAHDFEFKLLREGADGDPKERAVYPEHEYIVQYEESDWQFLSRWLEHEGVYFYFTNEDGEEKLVFADTESSYAAPLFGGTFPYHPEAGGDGGDSDKFVEEEVRTFRCRQQRLPKHVQVTDYNWRIPGRLQYSEDVLETGTGVQAEYNDHFKDEAQGKALAKLRAEELTCRARVFHGTSSCRSFRPGATFQLDEHFRSDWNRSYVLLSVTHDAEQMISTESATVTGTKYENSFEAIPDDQAWRPARTTEWPAIKGVMNATIDAEGDGHYAELDEHGRYKVIMQYDLHASDSDDGKASRWIRMAQPYAGKNAGMHFPLHKGTEVIITHIDGDPDRPIISGAVPNPTTESPATGANPTANSITTPAGNLLQMHDDDSRSGFLMMDALRSVVSDSRQRRKGTPATTAGTKKPGGGNAKPGASRSIVDSWSAFFADTVKDENGNDVLDADGNTTPTAFSQLSSHGTQFQDQEGSKGNGPTLTDPDTASGASFAKSGGNIKLTEENVVNALNYALGKGGESNLASYGLTNLGSANATGTATGKVGDLLKNQANDFLGSAKGTRVKIFLDDNVTFSIGDSYKYVDGSNEVSIGTGGNSYSETLAGSNSVSVSRGTQVSESTTWGDSESTSTTWGMSKSKSTTFGNASSESYTFNGHSSSSFEFSGAASFSFTLSAQTNNSIQIGAYNSNSLFVGLKGGIDICLAGKMDLSIYASVALNITIGAAAVYTIDLSLDDTELNLNHTKAQLITKQAALNKTIGQLLCQENTLQGTDNHLSVLRNSLASTMNAVSTTDNNLSSKTNALSIQNAGLSQNLTAMSNTQCAALVKSTAALTSL